MTGPPARDPAGTRVDHVVVRIDRAGNDGVSQTKGRIDDHSFAAGR